MLEREVKEKNLLIGKIRHESASLARVALLNRPALIASGDRPCRRHHERTSDRGAAAHQEELGRRKCRPVRAIPLEPPPVFKEHSTLTPRRHRSRLVTNILLSYLTTARGDSKRFEMLSLLSSILSWSDLEREQAGLQKSSAKAGSMLRRPSGIVARPIAEDEEEPAANEVRRSRSCCRCDRRLSADDSRPARLCCLPLPVLLAAVCRVLDEGGDLWAVSSLDARLASAQLVIPLTWAAEFLLALALGPVDADRLATGSEPHALARAVLVKLVVGRRQRPAESTVAAKRRIFAAATWYDGLVWPPSTGRRRRVADAGTCAGRRPVEPGEEEHWRAHGRV
jgi:hypothetical protein